MLGLLMETYAMIQKSILLQSHRTVVANFVPGKFGLFTRNPRFQIVHIYWDAHHLNFYNRTALQMCLIMSCRHVTAHYNTKDLQRFSSDKI